ncbi:multicopper oxidase domain-containing protein [Catellatospora sp. NEAU-YM18]|nr:multicopper oxidase domain-containing protein [Catellatospora tritici]
MAFVLVLVAAGLLGPGAPASAQPVTIDLCVEAGTLPLPGVAATPVWGFAVAGHDGAGQPTCVGVTPQVPGPVLTVNQGDTVAVVVHNDLAAAVSLEVPGIAVTQGAAPAPAHGSAAFTFVAAAPGTYLYQSPADAGRQLAMGLYGALIVRPPTAGQAYGVSSAYDTEAVTVLSAIDPAFNADPAGYDMHRYAATFWLINGKAYPQTSPIHGLAPGTRVLLRYLNAGFDNTTMVLLGLHQRVLAQDARVLANPFDSVAETIPAGATEDTIAVIPATGTRFPLYNRQLHLTNGTPANPQHTPGGMLTYLQVP